MWAVPASGRTVEQVELETRIAPGKSSGSGRILLPALPQFIDGGRAIRIARRPEGIHEGFAPVVLTQIEEGIEFLLGHQADDADQPITMLARQIFHRCGDFLIGSRTLGFYGAR